MRRKGGTFGCLALIFIQSGIILMLINYIKQQNHDFQKLRQHEFEKTRQDYSKIGSHLKTLKKEKLGSQAAEQILDQVESIVGINIGPLDEPLCGLGVIKANRVVCDEVFEPGKYSNPVLWSEGTWKKVEEEGCGENWAESVTIVLVSKHYVDERDLEVKYLDPFPGIRLILGTSTEFVATNPQIRVIETTDLTPFVWRNLIQSVQTPFVLIGFDLFGLNEWSELERSLRLLQDPLIKVVGGSVRNLTGHWATHCYQSRTSNYYLDLIPGYAASNCDCMHCDLLNGGPFMAKTEVFNSVPMDTNVPDIPTLFLNWFLDLKFQYPGSVLLCPDVMYFTFMSGNWITSLSRESWQSVAQNRQVQGIVVDPSPRPDVVFQCNEVELECNVEALQGEAKLLPWCCQQAFSHMLTTLLKMEESLGVQFELTSGSLLGGLKLGQFLPWDIDGDIYFSTEDFHHFKSPQGKGWILLDQAGISIYGVQNDNYYDKGAGYFKIFYQGIEIEMSGFRGDLSLGLVAAITTVPTKMYVAGVWFRVHANPGRYARSRYGSGYLRHAQSWRFNNMTDAYGGYHTDFWNLCSDPQSHGCLHNYPTDGNIMFHPNVFQPWHNPHQKVA